MVGQTNIDHYTDTRFFMSHLVFFLMVTIKLHTDLQNYVTVENWYRYIVKYMVVIV